MVNNELKKFVKTGIVFCLPLILFFGVSFVLLEASGELTSLDKIIERHQESKSSIVGLAYSNPLRYLKLKSVLARKPEVIMMGSSHTAFFRSAFFKSDVFYNASIGAAYPQDFRIFLNHIPIKDQPKVIIIGIDPAFFDTRCNWNDFSNVEFLNRQYTSAYNTSWRAWQFGFTQIYKDFLAGKFFWHDLPKFFKVNNHFGMNAVINQSGYKWDGNPINTKDLTRRLAESDGEFEKRTVAEFLSMENKQKCTLKFSKTIEEVKKFLAESQARKIHVIGFITPYTQAVYRLTQQMQDKERYAFLPKLGSALRPIFNQFGFKIFDFSDPSKVGIADHEMYDQHHASEKVSLRLFLLMREREPLLWPYSNAVYLKKRLQEAPNNISVFGKNEF